MRSVKVERLLKLRVYTICDRIYAFEHDAYTARFEYCQHEGQDKRATAYSS
jgi:hypothetical protein